MIDFLIFLFSFFQIDTDFDSCDNKNEFSFAISLHQILYLQLFAAAFPNASGAAIDLLQRLLVFDASKRLTAEEALDHPYLRDLKTPVCDTSTTAPEGTTQSNKRPSSAARTHTCPSTVGGNTNVLAAAKSCNTSCK